MALLPVSPDNEAQAADLNQYRDHLQGEVGSTDAYHFRSAGGADYIVTLSDSVGARKVSVRDSGGVEVFFVDSDGNVSFNGNFTVPTSAAPSQTTAGRLVYDTVRRILTVGNGSGGREAIALSIGTTQPSGAAVGHVWVDTTDNENPIIKVAQEDGA